MEVFSASHKQGFLCTHTEEVSKNDSHWKQITKQTYRGSRPTGWRALEHPLAEQKYLVIGPNSLHRQLKNKLILWHRHQERVTAFFCSGWDREGKGARGWRGCQVWEQRGVSLCGRSLRWGRVSSILSPPLSTWSSWPDFTHPGQMGLGTQDTHLRKHAGAVWVWIVWEFMLCFKVTISKAFLKQPWFLNSFPLVLNWAQMELSLLFPMVLCVFCGGCHPASGPGWLLDIRWHWLYWRRFTTKYCAARKLSAFNLIHTINSRFSVSLRVYFPTSPSIGISLSIIVLPCRQ